ncbi:MAG TPA: pyridoxal phosphate-dependent aminotransferase [bacterium (Candidatus Stahlbacteria)]|nr:pyridoxal phosphate-dependent aminotransferase [Candidatus Stahlbacteria bacterium]
MKISKRLEELGEEKIVGISGETKKRNIKYRFDMGIPDIPPPTWIREIDPSNFKYTEAQGVSKLREVLSKYLLEISNLDVDPDKEIVITCGGMHALYEIFQVLLDPGDEVLLPDIGWTPYRGHVLLAEGICKNYKLSEDEFQPDLEDILSKITPKTKAILINTPHNPTGAVIERAVLEEIALLAQRNGFFVISDEVYERIIFDDAKHYNIASLPRMKERAIIVNSLSKTFGITGFRVGYIVGPKEIIECVTKLNRYTITCSPSISQEYAYQVITHPKREEYIERIRNTYQNRRNVAVEELDKTDRISYVKPKGTFYVFPKILCSISDEEFTFGLMEHGVSVVPGSYLGGGGKQHIRISLTIGENDIREGIRILIRYLETYIN